MKIQRNLTMLVQKLIRSNRIKEKIPDISIKLAENIH
jgi:hypothetical protein